MKARFIVKITNRYLGQSIGVLKKYEKWILFIRYFANSMVWERDIDDPDVELGKYIRNYYFWQGMFYYYPRYVLKLNSLIPEKKILLSFVHIFVIYG